ncbi:MAG TPA: hypothetical protein VJN32_00115 [Dehalococcoidia bacterium]|nr:hypothetical protein [Dehalococcoidia bacterium]
MSHNAFHILQSLGIVREVSTCKPLGCKGVNPLDPLHACKPTGAWQPVPIGGT